MPSGIYEIVNKSNGKRYIGSAVNIDRRFNEHRSKLRRGVHHSVILQRAWNKNGEESFTFSTLVLCAKDELIAFEQGCIDAFAPMYNVCPTAGSSLGRALSVATKEKIAVKARGRKRDPESVERGATKLRGVPRLSEHLTGNTHAVGSKHTDEWKAANSARNLGVARPKDAAYRAKISASLKGVRHSPERRAKQAAAQRGMKKGPYTKKIAMMPANMEQETSHG